MRGILEGIQGGIGDKGREGQGAFIASIMCEIDAPKVSRDQELVELLTVELVVELPMIAEVGKWSGQCDTGPGG